MSNYARAWAERQNPGGGCQPHLLEVIAAYHNDDLGFCTASNRHLAARLHKSEATIERGLKGLVTLKLIERETMRWGPDGGARRRIKLKGYDPEAMRRELQELKRQALERRAARRRRGYAESPERAAPAAEPPVGCPQNEGQVPSFCGPGPLTSSGSESLAESQEIESSEAVASGTGGPAPGKKILFSEGRPILVGLGLDRKTAGDVIARWLRDTDDPPRVLGAIRDAGARSTLVPIPWITAHLNPRSNHARAERRPEVDQALDGLADRLRALEQLSRRAEADRAGAPAGAG